MQRTCLEVLNVRSIDIGDVSHESIVDSYDTCKWIERQGISLEAITLGNVHDEIEEMTDEHWLPIVQVINPDNQVEGYIIEA